MKKNVFLFTMLIALSAFAPNPSTNSNSESSRCFDWADEQVEEIANDLSDPNGIGAPVFLTYEEEHDLWLSIYDFCIEKGL